MMRVNSTFGRMGIAMLLFVFLAFSGPIQINAQATFQGSIVDLEAQAVLPEVATYQVFQLDLEAIYTYAQANKSRVDMTLALGGMTIPMTLFPNPVRRANAKIFLSTATGVKELPARPNTTYAGEIQSVQGGEIRLLIDKDMIGGAFAQNGKEYMIEPLWYYLPDADQNLIVVYEASISKSVQEMMCGSDMSLHQSDDHGKVGHDPDHDGDMAGVVGSACKQVEYGAACDYMFFDEYGGAGGAQNRIDLVMNLVEGQYNNGQLQHTYEFDIVEYWFSDCSTCDPWSSSNDAGTLLSSFRNWGNSGGFSVDTDVAGLWSDRDFAGSTIGIAYLSGICNSFGYHCLQDWTSNTSLMRVMVSHEIGHNFSCDHDAAGSNTIMAPAVNNTTIWSNGSISDINGYTNGGSGWCLSSCVPNAPPNGQFTADEVEGCAPLTVHFTDQSVNNPDTWYWSFPGGTPSFSTLQNPIVTYANKGLYSVTLEVSNAAGSDEITKTEYINVLDVPVPYFEVIIDEDFVTFFNLSDGGVSYYWEFGDGNFSFEENPVHTYEEDGVYEVTLSVTNQCGTTYYSEYITIVTPPIPEFSADETVGCAPLTVNFLDESSPNTTSWMWQFPGGTPSSSTMQNPTVVYQSKGKFSVTLTAINAAGSNSVTLMDYIIVNDVPTGTFSSELALPDTVKFTNETQDWVSLDWDFGDGSSSTDENPTHVYMDEGDYLVTLTATNACGDYTIEKIVTITAPPTADFSASPVTGCTPFEVTFIDNSAENITSYAWSFPGGNPTTSADQNPVVVYEAPGLYDVTLIVTNPAGADTVVLVEYIEAITSPQASFTKDGEGLVTFTNTSLYGSTFDWDFGDGATSNEENPVHQYEAEGNYVVALTVTNECGVDTYTEIVEITLPLTAGFKADVTSGCAPVEITFSNSSSPNATGWEWSFPGGEPASSTDENPVVIYNNAGDYTVTLIVSGASGFDTLVQTNYIIVGIAPEAGYSNVNIDSMVEFYSTSINSQTYNWNFGDGYTSFKENPVHKFEKEGLYHVTLLVGNECGISTYCQPIHVFFDKVANFSSDIREACASSMIVDFEDLSEQMPDTWAWTFEGGSPETSTAQNPSITYTTPGIYDVQLIASGTGWTDTLLLTDYIRLFDTIPNASFTYVADLLDVSFTNITEFGTCYKWEFEPAATSLDIDAEHVFSEFGAYNVQLIASNACGSDTVIQVVQVDNTSIELPAFLTGIQILPNPSNGLFTLELTGKPIGMLHYDVLDILGQQVYAGSVDFNASPLRHAIYMPDVPSGQYFLRLWDGVRPYAIRLQIAR
ncbi:MAG: PKD domain-containing protein [Saprospiraceae bacterium]|nr:PKD domain-containing protein [Saprospiraceae bacterium]